jgi:hypothetical protein
MKVKIELGKNGAWFVHVNGQYIADFKNKEDAELFIKYKYPCTSGLKY